MTTIHQLKTNLESAEAAYKSADIEHPTAVHLAKEALASARYEYWNACAELVTRLPGAITSGGECLGQIHAEITGNPAHAASCKMKLLGYLSEIGALRATQGAAAYFKKSKNGSATVPVFVECKP